VGATSAFAGSADPGPADTAALAPALIPILRQVAVTDCGAGAEVAALAETPAEWRELLARLRLPPPGLPADWADFARERIVVWACPRSRVQPPFAVAAATEEGVDVLTLTIRGPSGEDPGERAPCLVIAVPRRPHALTLVGRVGVGPAPPVERVLALLPPAR
jgi:hypothetical protein